MPFVLANGGPGPHTPPMFFRRKQSPSGFCLQLLESFRNAQGQPRQRVVVSLGDAVIARADQPRIAQAVARHFYGGGLPELLPAAVAPEATSSWVDQICKRIEREGRWQPVRSAPSPEPGEVIDGVLVEAISHTHTTPLGPTWVGWQAWNQLGLPDRLEQLGFNSVQRDAAAITVIQRLVAPGSERSLRAWLPNSSLPELLGRDLTSGGSDRFYRISDRLLRHRAELEAHLRAQTQTLFNLDRSILLYDLTNSYFEGEALHNPKAHRGKSKEKRDDCPQIVVGMVF